MRTAQGFFNGAPAYASYYRETRFEDDVDENVQEVYQARLAELERFEQVARKVHSKAIRKAAANGEPTTEPDAELARNLERINRNRKECRRNMSGTKF